MITQERANTVQTNGIKDSVSFGIKQDGLAHIFSVLRNQLYSDKILAVIREYTCNGVDAHTEAGKPNEPIVVTLPSRWDTTFKCRDFGLGLADSDIHDIYAFYGESTKRKSNAMIGQLGLGSKSAFAYGDNFVITSFVDGVKNTYNAFIDASQIGQIAKLASEPTTEPNGVEISIAVKDHDIQQFHDKAYNLFRYFKVRPTVHGGTFTYDALTPIVKGADWAIYGGNASNSVAIMGNIGYPIDNHWNDDQITATLSAGLQVDFAIGDLEISASREKLQYTDRTKQAIKDKLMRVVKEVSDELNTRFNSCATLFDAHKLYGTIMDYGSSLYVLRGMIKSSLQFNGKRISDATLYFNDAKNGEYSMRQYEPTYRSGKIKSWTYSNVKCTDKTVLIFNDLNLTNGITNRIYNLLQVDGKKVYILSYRDEAGKQAFLAESGLVESNFILLSSLPKISLATVTGVVKNAKHSSKEFVYDFNFAASASSWKQKCSDFWKQEVVDVANDAGVYVMLDAFKFQGKDGGFDQPSELNEIVESFKTFGIKLPTIYGFKEKNRAVVEANANMVSLWTFVEQELTAFFANNKIAQKLANRLEYDKHHNSNWLYSAAKIVKHIDATTEFATTFEKFEYMQHAKNKKILDEAVQYKQYFSATEKPEHDLGALNESLLTKYPMFALVRYWETDAKFIKNVSDYINLVGS